MHPITPSNPPKSKAVRITPEQYAAPDTLPCPAWFFIPANAGGFGGNDEWCRRTKPFTRQSVLVCTHWHPDQPNAPDAMWQETITRAKRLAAELGVEVVETPIEKAYQNDPNPIRVHVFDNSVPPTEPVFGSASPAPTEAPEKTIDEVAGVPAGSFAKFIEEQRASGGPEAHAMSAPSPAVPVGTATPRTYAMAQEIGRLAAAYRFGDLRADEFATKANTALNDARTLERESAVFKQEADDHYDKLLKLQSTLFATEARLKEAEGTILAVTNIAMASIKLSRSAFNDAAGERLTEIWDLLENHRPLIDANCALEDQLRTALTAQTELADGLAASIEELLSYKMHGFSLSLDDDFLKPMRAALARHAAAKEKKL